MSPTDNPVRRLVAIMFTDMVGYTALMQEDELKAKTFRDRHRSVLNRHVLGHGGMVLQYYGDGTLSTFPSAIHAVRCATGIQHELQQEPVIPLRIGLHIGDVIDEEGEIFGDGVNVASRIQALAVPGSVLISARVHEEIRNQLDLRAVMLGLFELKNVRQPVEIFALEAAGLKVPARSELSAQTAKYGKSIAVLPFVNMSRDPENEFFSDGISEEIINALTRVEGLKVTARTSSFAFKGKNADMREIGNELGVEALLEGSVRRSGDRVRVTAQLINAKDGFHAWSEVYDRQLADVFGIQDEISKAITDKLRLHFSKGSVPSVTHPANMEAYQLYLKALHHWNKWTPADSRAAIGLLEKAVALDPRFAIAYAWQAFCYTYLGALGQLSPSKAFPIAKQLTEKAFSLDGAIVEANLASGLIALFYDWDWDLAGSRIRKAIEISPGYATAHHLYGLYLTIMAKTEEAVSEIEIAVKLDPMSPVLGYVLAEVYMHARRFHDSLDQCRQVLLLNPNFRAAKNLLGWLYAGMGEVDKAVELLERTRAEIGDDLKGWSQLGYTYALAGRRADAEECLRKLTMLQEREPDAELSLDFSTVYQGLGDYDRAIQYMSEAVDRRLGGVIFMKTHPGWDPLRAHPGFKELLDRIGFPE
jgi:TolB-like protein/class 3 adenylate cyclase/Tfp pilus assembly protein PilF